MTPLLRESSIVRLLGHVVSMWATLFALTTIFVGDKLTSKQWIYLMSIPGGKWTWAVVYACAAGLILYGLRRKKYRVVAAGWSVVGSACGLVAVFYFLAPWMGSDIYTLGYYPWLLCAIFAFVLAQINRKPLEWF